MFSRRGHDRSRTLPKIAPRTKQDTTPELLLTHAVPTETRAGFHVRNTLPKYAVREASKFPMTLTASPARNHHPRRIEVPPRGRALKLPANPKRPVHPGSMLANPDRQHRANPSRARALERGTAVLRIALVIQMRMRIDQQNVNLRESKLSTHSSLRDRQRRRMEHIQIQMSLKEFVVAVAMQQLVADLDAECSN